MQQLYAYTHTHNPQARTSTPTHIHTYTQPMVQSISDESEHDYVVKQNPLIALKFSAEWCGPCKAIKPVFESLQASFPQIFFGDIDIDKVPEVAQLYGITAVPSFVFLHNGKIEDKVTGGDLPKISVALKKLAGKAPTFGRGKKVGSSTGSSEPSIAELRNIRMQKYQDEKASETTKDSKVETPQKPEKTTKSTSATGSTESYASDFIANAAFYVKLYFATLFSLDARGAAMRLRNA